MLTNSTLIYDHYVARHGEYGVQAIIERIERYEGISPHTGISLKERWHIVMHNYAVTKNLTPTRA